MVKTLVNYLKDFNHQGREKAQVGSRICTDLNIKDTQQLRALVNTARVQGFPVCSCADGYYYAENEDEVEQCCRSLEGRARGILKASNGMKTGIVLREAIEQ